MSSIKKNKWAIIESRVNKKIKAIRITDWPEYKWDELKTIKKYRDVLLFSDEEDAINFILEHFDASQIDPDILENNKLPDGYHW